MSLPSPTVTATVHEVASQTSLLNSRARAASPSPSQLLPATVTFSTADTVTTACREPPVSPAVSRASPTTPDSAPDASYVAPDIPTAASESGPVASPPAATATHHMVTRYLGRIQLENYSLYYAGKLVEDRMTVASLEIQNGATFQMVTNPNDKLSISVKTLNGGTVVVEVWCWHTVVQVKEIVESMTNCSSEDWDLSVGMKMRLRNSKTLAFYDIKEKDILKMLPALYQISVRTRDGKITKIEGVKQSDTIHAVKEKYFEQTDVPVNRQRLTFGGKILEDDKDLAHYSIEEGFTIHV
ncbi:hypothetical protein EZV62_000949 [Acer yangbiense]|uniref:Ubiquitin-like domain-containing protein n=1 Tax=Acer yangbiense TaxID=1000413 RepID=A0A5C7ISQ9_9ROSI|nr:hypothetical protein EZV62_000949 [Acer yangbiense]